jgi:CRP/FNR family transcriptional regulator, polysaccharide utilization system transcription regulator
MFIDQNMSKIKSGLTNLSFMEDKLHKRNCRDCDIKLPIFQSLTDEQLDMIDKVRYEVKFRPGETIFKQGTAMTHIVTITDGLVKIYLEGIGNRNLILRLARPVTMIGGPGFFTDYKHHITSMAVEETTACFIDVNTMIRIIEVNKDFAIGLLKWVNAHTLTNYTKFIELTQKGMHGRIAGALLYLHNEVFKDRYGDIRINRQDLADLTAMSKESAIRILKEFKDEKTISAVDNTIVINDLIRLAEISMKG